MPGVSEEQVRQARQVDLLSYLQHNEPHELIKFGRSEYRMKTHGSLVISKGMFYWNRGGFGGRSAIDYLIKVRGMGFVDAVQAILGARASPTFSLPTENIEQPTPINAEFELPETVQFPSKATAYLQRRGISPKIISRCIELGIIAETKKYQNVMFIGRDEEGEARFACLRGTRDNFKLDVFGSRKMYSFVIPAVDPDSRHLACFESPIDALSHATLGERSGWKWDGHRLSLGGTSPMAVISFLARNQHITRVMLHLDNDEAGFISARRIKTELRQDSRFKHINISINPPRGANDYNEVLLRTITAEREQKQRSQHTPTL